MFALLDRSYAEFASAYAERYAARYGSWRPLIAGAVRDFLKCGRQMKIIAFLEKRDQAAEIEKILRHCGLWTETAARAPPAEPAPVQMELLYVADGEPCPSYDATG